MIMIMSTLFALTIGMSIGILIATVLIKEEVQKGKENENY